MDLMVTDKNLSALSIIDEYSSVIWTERYGSAGEFELTVPIGTTAASYFTHANFIVRSDSERIMMIENIEETWSAEDRDNKLVISGRSIEAFLKHRYATHAIRSKTQHEPFVNNRRYDAPPASIMNMLVYDYIVSGNWINNDSLRWSWEVDEYPYPGNEANYLTLRNPSRLPTLDATRLPEDNYRQAKIVMHMDGLEIYATLVDLSSTYNIGFKIVKQPGGASQYAFKTYRGVDRPSAIFDKEDGHVASYRKYKSNSNFKNRIMSTAFETYLGTFDKADRNSFHQTRLWHEYDHGGGPGSTTWYSSAFNCPDILKNNTGAALEGFDYRPQLYDNNPHTNIQNVNKMYQIWYDDISDLMANHAYVNLLEVDIQPNSGPPYISMGTVPESSNGYSLGDTVRVRLNGEEYKAKVLEVTESEDSAGTKIWPTLSIITEG